METILQMQHISKQFPGVLANDDISLDIYKGEVHAILGENGAGKSTLMNILSGLYKPTTGNIILEGTPVKFSSAKDAMERGIGMVHQHFMLIPKFSVVENLLIGDREPGCVTKKEETAKEIQKIADEYHMKIDPFAKVKHLSVGERQRVEIIKALYRGAKILILDEPTSVLTPQETEELFKMIRALIAVGYTILFISHKLNEIKEISDRVSVMRSGKLIGTYLTDNCTTEELARLMVNRDIDFSILPTPVKSEKKVLQVRNLCLKGENEKSPKLLDNLNFYIREGEIVGIAGVDGNGQSELEDCLTGLREASSGEAIYENENILNWSTRKIKAHDVSHIPQDRQTSGLVLSMNITENMIVEDYYKKEFGKNGFLDWNYAIDYSNRLINEFNVKTPNRLELAKNLSGGNQQCVIIARELSRHPKLLIAMHPTRGMDVGRIEYIHKLLIQQRQEGLAILLISTELEEVLKLSDRIYVMYEGRFMGEVKPSETNIDQIGLMMGGFVHSAKK